MLTSSLLLRRGIDIYDRWSLSLIAMASVSTGLYLALALLGGVWNGGVGVMGGASPDVSLSLKEILDKAHRGPLYTYPTSLTQEIVTVRSFEYPRFVV